jgi:hypothetical protein
MTSRLLRFSVPRSVARRSPPWSGTWQPPRSRCSPRFLRSTLPLLLRTAQRPLLPPALFLFPAPLLLRITSDSAHFRALQLCRLPGGKAAFVGAHFVHRLVALRTAIAGPRGTANGPACSGKETCKSWNWKRSQKVRREDLDFMLQHHLGWRSFVAQGVDRIEARGLPRRVVTEHNADGGGHDHGGDDRSH